jgi:hypothetical protein
MWSIPHRNAVACVADKCGVLNNEVAPLPEQASVPRANMGEEPVGGHSENRHAGLCGAICLQGNFSMDECTIPVVELHVIRIGGNVSCSSGGYRKERGAVLDAHPTDVDDTARVIGEANINRWEWFVADSD